MTIHALRFTTDDKDSGTLATLPLLWAGKSQTLHG